MQGQCRGPPERQGWAPHPQAAICGVRWASLLEDKAHMAGRVGSVHQSKDGKAYGFIIYDDADRACVYFGFSSWHEADNAARQAQSLLITAMRCVRR